MTLPFVCFLFLIVAFLYSSVGHGGASGYLAVLSVFAYAPKEMASTALMLNVIVAGIAFTIYYRAGYFSSKLSLPFLICSVPFAFLGGMIHVESNIYSIILAIALLAAAFRLIVKVESLSMRPEEYVTPPMLYTIPLGAVIGFISGVVGVGGGIFLSPVILLMRWADPKKTSATSACFIIVNSIAGIIGRLFQGNLATGTMFPFLLAAVTGGLLGSWWGARKSSNITLRRLLGVALVIAASKLLVTAFTL